MRETGFDAPPRERSHSGRAYVIVGGSSGMGYAAAQELAHDGGAIALIGRSAAKARLKAMAIADATGAPVSGFGTDEIPLDTAIDRAAQQIGGVDGLAVTAGPLGETGPLDQLADSAWQESFEMQLMPVVRACRAAMPHMRKRGAGRIVTIAAYSIRSQKSFLPHYAAMKSAVASVTKHVAKFGGADGITANCIAPGAIDTEALDGAAAEAMAIHRLEREPALGKFMAERWKMDVALGRPGRPAEAGALIAFLLSPKSAYLTGALINLDGGTDF